MCDVFVIMLVKMYSGQMKLKTCIEHDKTYQTILACLYKQFWNANLKRLFGVNVMVHFKGSFNIYATLTCLIYEFWDKKQDDEIYDQCGVWHVTEKTEYF